MLKYKINILIFILVVFFCSSIEGISFDFFDEENVLNFDPSSLTIQLKSAKNIRICLVDSTIGKAISINFTYGDENGINSNTDIIKTLPSITFLPNGNNCISLGLYAQNVGHLVVGAESNDLKIPFGNIFRVDVIHSDAINIIVDIVGWIYFIAWSISFYPQTILNYRLKNVSGLSFDFIALNFLGFTCYTVFNISFFWIKEVQNEYSQKHPRGVNPVLLNDVLFAVHAVILTAVTIVQCIIYRTPRQKISYISLAILGVLIGFLCISGIVTATGNLGLLEYMYFFSYVKLAITIMKYIPQAYKNYQRKSTVGWSIVNVLLDFTGGSFSLLQMFFLSYNYNDWGSIFGSPTKLGLGLLSIFFDIIFMTQHYILYKYRSETDSYTPIA